MAINLRDRIDAEKAEKHAQERALYEQFDGLDSPNLAEAIAAMATDIREAEIGKKEADAGFNEVIKSTKHRMGVALDVRTERKRVEGAADAEEEVGNVLSAAR